MKFRRRDGAWLMETDGPGASDDISSVAKHLRGLGMIVPSPPPFSSTLHGPLSRRRDRSGRPRWLYLVNLETSRLLAAALAQVPASCAELASPS